MKPKPIKQSGPAGDAWRAVASGPQLVRSSGKRWTGAAEARFLDHLAVTCNVRASAAACGFDLSLVYRKRRADAAFALRWQAALEQGYAHLETLLVQRATEQLEGRDPDPANPVMPMTAKDVLAVLAAHRASVLRLPGGRRRWARPRSLDEMRDSILAKLEAFVPHSTMALNPPRIGGTAGVPQEQRNRREAVVEGALGSHSTCDGGSPPGAAIEEAPLRQLCELPPPRPGED